MQNKKYHKKNYSPNSSDNPGHNAWPKKELFLLEPKTLVIIIIASVLTLAIAFFGEQGAKFLTSVLSPIPAHAPFDGTVFPVKQVPNWVKLTEAERKTTFDKIPAEKLISLPLYNPTKLVVPFENLKWNNSTDDAVRNEKVTYSVPYLGSYKLDGLENSGSHPAVDIKIPVGTPIYAIANGTVIKTQISNGGFGNNIVIQHNDFPAPNAGAGTETIFSAYCHLSSISVTTYEVVTKGQLIGFSGESGTATTPHLHFQIDNSKAPWHPYWPFSNADMQAAGVSFFEAINNGLKKENAVAHTINPMSYVQNHLSDQTLMVSAAPEAAKAISDFLDEYENLSFLIQIPAGDKFEEGSEIKIFIQAFNANGVLVSDTKFKDEISLSLLNGNGSLAPQILHSSDFETGITSSVSITGSKPGTDKVILRFREKEFSSPEFEIKAKQDEARNAAEEISGQPAQDSAAQDPAGNTAAANAESVDTQNSTAQNPVVTDDFSNTLPFKDIAPESPYFQALKTLKEAGLVAGYEDGTFQPDRAVSRAEAVTFILRAIKEQIREAHKQAFPDVKPDEWFFKFITTAFELGFVKGYPDGSFKPNTTVNLAEFLTMLFVGAKTDVDPQIVLALPQGVVATDWFAPYVQEALKRSILDIQNNTLDAAKPMTRGEIAQMLYRLGAK